MSRSYFIDGAALLTVSVILALIHFFLSDALYAQLVFTYDDASLVTAWTTAYLHLSNEHLYSNLAGYPLAAGPAYLLYVRALSYRRRFWLTFVMLLVVVPPVTTAIDYIVLYQHAGLLAGDAVSAGFSGVVSAIGGMILAAIGISTAEKHGLMTGTHTVLLTVLAALGVLVTANGALTPTVAGLLVFAALLQGTTFVSRADLRTPGQLQAKLEDHAETITRVGWSATVVCLVVYAMIPFDIVQSGSFVNVLAHTTGFVVGSITTVLVAVQDSIS